MSRSARVAAVSDSHVRQGAPATNYGTAGKLLLRGTGSSLQEQAFLHVTLPFPVGATVLAATLRVYRAGAWTGTKTVNVRRVTEKWSEGGVTYNARPATVATNAVAVTANAGADGSEIAADVTLLMRDVAAAGAYFGLRLDLTQDAEAAVRSSEAGNTDLRPVLDVEWSEPGDPPDRLTPADGLAVSATKPVLAWQTSEQASYQVQVATDAAFTSLSLDTGKVAGADQQLDTSTTALPAIASGATRYWRVRVWNSADVVTGWSDGAVFVRQPLAALAITSPAATTDDTTPPIVWTFTGQTRYRVRLERVDPSGPAALLWDMRYADTSTTRTPPPGLIVTGQQYRVTVDAWDAVDRANDEHATAVQVFTYARSGVPAAPTGLTAAAYAPGTDGASPAVILEWHRTAAPDYWSLRVDGVEVNTRIDVPSTAAGGDLYRLHYWGLAPRTAHVLEIEAVIEDAPGSTQASGPNPTVSFTPQPIGIWLVDDASASATPGDYVQLLSTQDAGFEIGEAATTYTPVGNQAPVRITDMVRGYEGDVGGTIHSDAGRDTLYRLKARQAPVRLVLAYLSFPVWLEGVSCEPTPVPGAPVYEASVSFFQVADPWPVPWPVA